MSVATLTVACLAILAFTLVGRWLGKRYITAPMFLVAVGAVSFWLYKPIDIKGSTVHVLAEITLVLVLFHDASTVRLRDLARDAGPPVRLLAIGFPLAVLATVGIGWWLLPAIGGYGALLLAAAITPTDAGLGAPTVLNPVVPVRVRRMLNVESGLNDGLATPVVLFALTAIAAADGESVPALIDFAVAPLALGVLVGVVGALVIALLLGATQKRAWAARQTAPITILITPIALFLVSDLVHANAFIAAFVGGLVFGGASKTLAAEPESSQLLETGSDLAGWMVWFFAGGLMVEVFGDGISWQSVVIAVSALTILRIGPVALSLVGSGFQSPTVLFVGWFGPRGLATVVFSLLIAEELGVGNPVVEPIVVTLALGVLLSVFAHGISASPLAAKYGAWVQRSNPPAEIRAVPEPARRGYVWAARSRIRSTEQ